MTDFGTGNFRQKNKPFKSKKKQDQFKAVTKKNKKITKQKDEENNKMEIEIGKTENQQQQKDQYQQQTRTTIVLFTQLNQLPNNHVFQQFIHNHFDIIQNDLLSQQGFVQTQNILLVELKEKQKYKKKQQFILIDCPRTDQQYLNYIKIADIQINLTSMLNANTNQMHLNAADKINAFDQIGYSFLNLQRAVGGLQNFNLVFDLDLIPKKHQQDLRFYYKRQLEQELHNSQTFFIDNSAHNFDKFLLTLQQVSYNKPVWRQQWGYLLVDHIKTNQNQVFVSGVVKNSLALNELLHLTGYGDLKPSAFYIQEQSNNYIDKTPNVQHSFEISIDQKDSKMFEEDLQQLQKDFQTLNVQKETIKEQQANNNKEETDGSFSEDENHQKIESKKSLFQLQKRNEEDLDFEDEVEYEQSTIVRERFKKYKHLKSFRNSFWNKYAEIPDNFIKLSIIKDYTKQQKLALDLHQQETIAQENTRVIILFNNKELFDNLTQGHIQSPLILSSLYSNERQLTIQNSLVKFHNENDKTIQSKKDYIIHAGFKIQKSNILFSQYENNNDKNKMLKKINPQYNKWFFASYYSQINMDNAPVILFEDNKQNHIGQILMIGDQTKPDPFKVILKRIILTGYPIKIKKRTAIVRFMFFNVEDINYYKVNEVYNKKGMQGKIMESLGTHGSMKVRFNNFIKQGDVVCMNLFKRVFPKFLY